jgi:hypothetical protein
MIGKTKPGAEIGINEDRDVREQREIIRELCRGEESRR